MESDDSYSYSYSYSRSPSPARGGARSPPPDEPRRRAASAVLAVSNLTLDVTIAHLREIFELFGPVSTVELAIDRAAGLPKGYAYVEFASHDCAEAAARHLDDGEIDGRHVRVNFIGQSGGSRLERADAHRRRPEPPPPRPAMGPSGPPPPPPPPPPRGRSRSPPHWRRAPPPRSAAPPRRRRSPPPRRSPPRARRSASLARDGE